MFSKKILAWGLILITGSILLVSFPSITSAISSSPNYETGTVQLPRCSFNDDPGVYVKHVLCSWEDSRCEININIPNSDPDDPSGSNRSNCSQTCWGGNKVATGEEGRILAATAYTLSASTKLCTTTLDPSQINMKTCPFDGETGEVWIKPVYTNWNEASKCLVGSDCWQQPIKLSLGAVNILGHQIEAGGSLNVRTKGSDPGRATAWSQATIASISWAYDTCIIKSGSSTDNGNGSDNGDDDDSGGGSPTTGENTPASGTITASSNSIEINQPVDITVSGEDADGMQYVGLKQEGQTWDWSDQGSGTSLSKTWTFTPTAEGTYTFYGAINGTNPTLTSQEKIESLRTTPSSITITVTAGTGSGGGSPTTGENTPASGTLTASTTSIEIDQPVDITVSGEDADGMQYVGLKQEGQTWDWSDQGSGTTLSKTWTFSTSEAGSYTFYGAVNGTDLNASTPEKIEAKRTTPSQLTITVTEVCGETTPGENTLASGSLIASAESIEVNQSVNVTVSGVDADGMQYVGLKQEGQTWDWSDQGSGTTLSKTWTFTPTEEGSYTFYGVVNGTDPTLTDSDKLETVKTDPYQITINATVSGDGGGGDDGTTPPPASGENTPANGTLTASATSVGVNQPVNITVNGQDPDGMQYVGLKQGNQAWDWSDKGSGTTLSKTWTFTPKAEGTYTFYGSVNGTDPKKTDGWKLESVHTIPSQLTIAATTTANAGGDGGTTPEDNRIHLPSCNFEEDDDDLFHFVLDEDKSSIWAKNSNCGGWDNKCPLGHSCNSSCGLLGIYRLDTVSNFGVQSLMLPAFSNSFDLCIQGDPTDFSVAPPCPFEGITGDVWASPNPASGALVNWDTRVKVGYSSQAEKEAFSELAEQVDNLQELLDLAQNLGISFELDDPGIVAMLDQSLNNAGIEIEIDSFSDLLGLTQYLEEAGNILNQIQIPNASFNIQSHSEWPGRVTAGISNGGFFLQLPTPVKVCVVGGTAEGLFISNLTRTRNESASDNGEEAGDESANENTSEGTTPEESEGTTPGESEGTTPGESEGTTPEESEDTSGCGCGGDNDNEPETKPSVTTLSAENIGDYSVTLKGQVSDLGNCWPERASVFFDWGTTGAYENQEYVTAADSTGTFTASLDNLNPGTTYYYRIKASNCAGISYGQSYSFTTSGSYIPLGEAKITTQAASNVTSQGATINIKVESLGNWTSGNVYLEWQEQGSTCTANSYFVSAVFEPQTVEKNLYPLAPGTAYQARAKISGSHPGEWAYGEWITFTTD